MDEDEKFSDDPIEHLKIENEILRIKMQAQHGDAFFMSESTAMPPEIENEFLKNIIAFEENYANAEYTTVYQRIGSPTYQKITELQPHEVENALTQIISIMEAEGVFLDICDGPYPHEIIYTFITEELFTHEIEKIPFFDNGSHFIYEEFHPNNPAEIEKNTHDFIAHWMQKEFTDYSSELAVECINKAGKQVTRAELFAKMDLFFDSFIAFTNEEYSINDIHVEPVNVNEGLGHAEGNISYNAELENGEIITYKGPFKLYMNQENKYWSIYYFEFPGFEW